MRAVFSFLNEKTLLPLHTGYSRTRMGGKKVPLLKICHTYPAMMKLGAVIP